jgi:hypothetical protein
MSEELEALTTRLAEALETRTRAIEGSDKNWRKECRQEVDNLRGLIARQLLKEDEQ